MLFTIFKDAMSICATFIISDKCYNILRTWLKQYALPKEWQFYQQIGVLYQKRYQQQQ